MLVLCVTHMCISIGLCWVGFGLVSWYIIHCWLFKAKSCFYLYIKYIWFVNTFCRYTQLNDQTVLFLTIQFNKSFACIQFKCQIVLFYSLIGLYQMLPLWTWERWQRKSTLHSPKLQHFWSLTIRLFSVIIQDTHLMGFAPLQKCTWCIL